MTDIKKVTDVALGWMPEYKILNDNQIKLEKREEDKRTLDLEDFNPLLKLQEGVRKAAEEKARKEKQQKDAVQQIATDFEKRHRLTPNVSNLYILEEGKWKTVKYLGVEKRGSYTRLIVEGGVFKQYDYPNAIVALSVEDMISQGNTARLLDQLNREKIESRKAKNNKK